MVDRNYPVAIIATKAYEKFGIEKDSELKIYQFYQSGNIEVGSPYGLIMVTPDSYMLKMESKKDRKKKYV